MGRPIVLPVRIDNEVLPTAEPWVQKILDRHMANFTGWQNPVVFKILSIHSLETFSMRSGETEAVPRHFDDWVAACE